MFGNVSQMTKNIPFILKNQKDQPEHEKIFKILTKKLKKAKVGGMQNWITKQFYKKRLPDEKN
jgi:hypothetical protein